MKYGILVAAALVSLSACGAAKNKKTNPVLAYKKWELSALGTTKFTAAKERTPTLYFTDSTKSIGGNGGCNAFGAKYTINNSKIAIKDIIATQRACFPGMDVETKVFTSLQAVDNYTITNNTLLLKKGNVILLEYKPAAADKK